MPLTAPITVEKLGHVEHVRYVRTTPSSSTSGRKDFTFRLFSILAGRTHRRYVGDDDGVGGGISVPCLLHSTLDGGLTGAEIAGFAWVAGEIEELPVAGTGGAAHPEQLLVPLPDEAVAEEFAGNP